MTSYPTPDLVMMALLRLLFPDQGITTSLPALTVPDGKNAPKDNWGRSEWITITTVGGSVPNLPMRNAFLQVHVWSKGKKPNDQATWGRAGTLAQSIISTTTDWYTNLYVEMPYQGYFPVSISSFAAINDARRIERDPQGLAHYVFDAELAYSFLNNPQPLPSTDPIGGSDSVDVFDPLEFNFINPTMTWNVPHNLGRYPQVAIIDDSGNEVEGAVTHLSLNLLIVQFTNPMTGKVTVE